MIHGLHEETRRWVEEVVGARVLARRRLRGGLISLVDALRVESASGARRTVVLRRYDAYSGDVSGALAYEAQILAAVEAVELPTPKLIGLRDDALLMTMLPGRADLEPVDIALRLKRLAEAMVVLHDATAALASVAREHRPGLRDFSWVRDADLRVAAASLLATPPPAFAPVPCHGDFQHFNTLWTRQRLTGLLDWSGIWTGPAEIDVGHCRLNLAVLHSPDVSDAFLGTYESVAGRRVDRWWDVHRIGVYSNDWPHFIPLQVAGRASLKKGMTARVEELLRRAISRD